MIRVAGSPFAHRTPRDIGDGWAEVCAIGDDYWRLVEWTDILVDDDDDVCECGDITCTWSTGR